MIFVTVGTQLTFPRLTRTVIDWAQVHQKECIVQGESSYLCKPIQMPAEEFDRHFDAAELVVAHLGIGTLLKCAKAKKPLLVMPRRVFFREHRNDHQMATATSLESQLKGMLAWDEAQLLDLLNSGIHIVPQVANHNQIKYFCEELKTLMMD